MRFDEPLPLRLGNARLVENQGPHLARRCGIRRPALDQHPALVQQRALLFLRRPAYLGPQLAKLEPQRAGFPAVHPRHRLLDHGDERGGIVAKGEQALVLEEFLVADGEAGR